MKLQGPRGARAALLIVAALLGLAAGAVPASASGVTLSGTITDSSTGTGVAGAQVSTQPATSSSTTDSSGNYSLTLAPGSYDLMVSASGYNANFTPVTVGSSGATANLALAAIPPQSAQDLFSRPNQSGFGTASDGHTWSTDNAAANVSINGGQLSLQTSGTSVDGWMGISYQDQVVSADIDVTSGTARVLARVTASGTWVALVVDPGNDNLVLYTVVNNTWNQIGFWAAAPNLAFNTWYHVRLETVGSFVGAKEWLFGDPEPAWEATANQSTVTGTGVGGVGSAGSSDVVSSFTEAPVTQVSGTVTDAASGQPIQNATVTAGGTSATTDTSGNYAVGGLAAGTYTVTATAPNYSSGTSGSRQVTVSTGVSATASLSLNYSPAPPPPPPTGNSTVTGMVTDSSSGAPISGARVTTAPATGSVVTDSSGNYSLSINAGTYDIVVNNAGYNSNHAPASPAVGSPATANVQLTAIPPLTSMDLFTRPDQSGIGTATDGHAWTDDHAVYNLGNEQISQNQLVVQTAARSTDYDAWMGNSYQDEQVSVDFDCVTGLGARVLARVQGEETWVTLVAGGSSIVLWAAKNGTWTSLGSASISVTTGFWYHAKLAVIGTKVYGKVWQFGSAEPSWQVTGTQSIVNGSGVGGIRTAGADTNYQNFTSVPITQISGQVTDTATSSPISGATVSVAGGPSTTTDSNGLYTFSGLAQGTYSVTAAAAGYNSSTQSTSLTTGLSSTLNFPLTSSTATNSPYIVQDTFQRANQSGWGTASNGMVWSSGTGLTIAGNEGTVSNSPSSQFETLGSATTADGNGLVRFSVAATNDTAGILMRNQSNGSALLARYDGGGNLQLMGKSGGSWTTVAKTPVSVTAGTFYWLRCLVQGGGVSMKLWQNGTVEPSAWTWTGSTTITGAGTMGLYAWAASGAPVSFDSFSVAPLTTTPTLNAALTVTPQSGKAPLQVTADASGSQAGANPIASYTFDFGDGTTVGPQAGSTATHTYTATGSVTARVTVTDTAGATSTASASVNVVVAPPTAALTVSPSSGTTPLTVVADASGSQPGTNPISTYSFNFGDGTSTGAQTSATANHMYTTGGNFTVTVTVTATDGSTGTATAAVAVTATTTVQDTFQRANQSGWGTASNGMTWSAGSGLSIANNEGLISNSSSSQYELLGSVTAADGNGLVRFSVAALNDTAGVVLRYQSNGDMELARYDGAGNLQLMVRSGGTWTTVSKTPVSLTANTFYWLRFVVQGSNDSLRFWKSGTTEPSTWTWTGTSSTLTSAGRMGLYGWAASGSPVSFDSFSVS